MTGMDPVWWEYIPYILQGAIWTFTLVGGGLALGFAIGVPVAMGQKYGPTWLKAVLDVYVWFFRGTPLVVLLFLFYWGIFPVLLGIKLDALTTSVIVLGLRSGAYQSQIFRGALNSVDEGQMLAARALGMSKWQAITNIILPQALRIAIPGWTNEYAIILKDSAICFTLGVVEILTRTRYVVISTGEALGPFLFAGILYIIFTYGGTKVFNIIYEKYHIPGLVGKGM